MSASIDPISVLFVLSSVIILGFSASIIFRKTGFPDILMLIFLGILFGPVLHVLDEEIVKAIVAPVGALAIALILFDGGLGLNLNTLIKETPKALGAAILWFISSLVIVGVFTSLVLGLDPWLGMYLGASVGGLSAPVALGLLREVRVDDEIRARLVLESVVSDVICIVIGISLLDSILHGSMDAASIAGIILSKASTGLVIGSVLGIIWMLILIRLHKHMKQVEYEYIATIGLAILAYTIAEYSRASGGIASLSFGLTLSNRWVLQPLVDFSPYEKMFKNINRFLKRFSNEISFFMKSFFFTHFGMLFVFTDIYLMLYSTIIVILLMISRFIVVYPLTRDKPKYYPLVSSMVGKGLAAAVLIQLPYTMGVPGGELVFDLGVNIVFISLVATVVAAFIYQKMERHRVHKKR